MAAWINAYGPEANLEAIAMSDGLHNGFPQGNWQLARWLRDLRPVLVEAVGISHRATGRGKVS